MDPLLVTASIVALLGTCGTILRTINKIVTLRKAPDVILALNNELADLQLILTEIKYLLGGHHQRESSSRSNFRVTLVNMARKLQRARDKLDELQNFIEYDLTKVPTADGLINVDKMIWVRRQGKIQSLPDETRTTKVDLVVGISLLDSNALQRMEAKLLGLESGYGSLHNQQTHQQATTSHILAKQVELTDNVLPGILATQESTNRKIGELIQIYHSSQENRALSFPQPRPQERQQAHWNFRISFSHRNLACNLGCNYKHGPINRIAWSGIFGRPGEAAKHLQRLFPHHDVEEHQFSIIHEMVLQLNYLTLEQELEKSGTGVLGAGDDQGVTALSRSAMRGDISAVEFLLRNGADMYKPNRLGATPLLRATMAVRDDMTVASYRCVKALLEK
ncbi:MAG: hypothetical protein MMC33_006384 [Icmadophila ericetorum]|nr:hypothetical protein [Icmadophila ericetorum]